MPLQSGSSREVISANIKDMMAAGHKQSQAVAASLRKAGKSRKGYALGGAPGVPLGSAPGGGFNIGNAMNVGSPWSASGLGTFGGMRGVSDPTMRPPGGWDGGFSGKSIGSEPASTPSMPMSMQPYGHIAPLPASMGMGLGRQGGGMVPWFARNEARGMMHTGPIHSLVPGRTDKISMKVPGGSYVLPADYISHLGQNNTNAGMAKANLMFGKTGPFGAPITKIAQGRGAIRAPPAPRLSTHTAASGMSKMPVPFTTSAGHKQSFTPATPFGSATGGGLYQGGTPEGDPVDVMIAGGEFILHPDIVRNIGGGNIEHGHQILDEHVMDMRKKHIQTLTKLPRPAK
jgi:hypothetical protein